MTLTVSISEATNTITMFSNSVSSHVEKDGGFSMNSINYSIKLYLIVSQLTVEFSYPFKSCFITAQKIN